MFSNRNKLNNSLEKSLVLTNKMSVSKLKNSLGENESLLLVSSSKTSADPGFVIYVDRDQVKILLSNKVLF